MLNKCKDIILGSSFLSRIFFSFLRLKNRYALKEVERRRHLSLFEYQELAKPLALFPLYNIKDNNLYGTGKVLDAAGLGLPVNNCLIEHGLIFGNLVQRHNAISFAKSIVTFSSYRKEKLQLKTSKDVICVGPYIKYAKPVLDADGIREIKVKLGRILLVFPTHSNDVTTIRFGTNDFIGQIEKVAKNFDSVLICMFWKDIMLGRADSYLKKGYLITCAGHVYDKHFLDRLKTIIQLADFTMSNSVGTHVGYCVCLGKGHFIFKQEIETIHQSKSAESKQRNTEDWYSYYFDVSQVENIFNSIELLPSSSQLQVVHKFWGDF